MNYGFAGKRSVVLATVVMALCVACTAWGKVIYVDDDATAPGDGTSWATAYRFLQDALSDAEAAEEPVEIRVAQGVYRPDRSLAHPQGNRDRLASFAMLDNVAIRGGFAGVGFTDPNVRDSSLFQVVLSGDLAGDDAKVSGPEALFGEPTRAENSYTVVRAECVDHTATLEGCIVAAGSSPGHMGGLYCFCSTPTIVGCTFIGNSSTEGVGGLLADGASPALTNCTFLGNAGLEGGGLLATSDSAPVVSGCRFSGNVSSLGGAVLCSGSISLRGCLITDCGSAVALHHATFTMVNCTLAGNYPAENAALRLGYGTVAEIRNCILWNSGIEISGEDTSHLTIGYCDVRGGRGGVEMADSQLDWEQGNIDADPLFVGGGIEGFQLRGYRRYDRDSGWVHDTVASPCIDAGHPLDPVRHEPSPSGGRINMGAYGGTLLATPSYAEGASCEAVPAGDFNGDCRVDFKDLAVLASRWLENGSETVSTGSDDRFFLFSVGAVWTYANGAEELTFRVLGTEAINGATYYRLDDYFSFGLGDDLSPNVGDEVLLRYDPASKCLVMRLADESEAEVLCLLDTSVWDHRCSEWGRSCGLRWYLVDHFWPCDTPYAQLVTTRLQQRDGAVTHLAADIGIVRYVHPILGGYAGYHVFELKGYGASTAP